MSNRLLDKRSADWSLIFPLDMDLVHVYIMFTCRTNGGALRQDQINLGADSIRRHAAEVYVTPARQRHDKVVSINAGAVHRDLGLNNLVPSVCSALASRKFLAENRLRLVSKTGPPSGKSTTVTYTYEFVDSQKEADNGPDRQDAWNRLRGALKDVFAELGGGENYLRNERANFYGPGKDR